MIAFSAVFKRYASGMVAVNGLDLVAPTGKVTVLVGPSGCGKTTSLRMVNRLITPTSGTIALDGEDTAAMDVAATDGIHRRRLGRFPGKRTARDHLCRRLAGQGHQGRDQAQYRQPRSLHAGPDRQLDRCHSRVFRRHVELLDKNSTVSAPAEVADALRKALPKGITMLKISDVQDSDVVAVTHTTADKDKLSSIADLKPHAHEMVLGGPPEWKSRKEAVVGLKHVYALTFKTLDVAGPLTLSALVNGQVQAADMTSTDPAMKESELVALKDPKNLFPAQNIVPLIAEKKSNDRVVAVLNAVSAALTTDDLITMNARLNNHDGFDAVAADWLKAHNLK